MSLVQYNFLHLPERIEFTNTKMIMHETGYLTKENGTWKYFYYLKDHVGSNRLVLDDQGGEVQINNFYPYGLTQAEPTPRTDQAEQPYKFGGKELDRDFGVDAYDFEARMYNPAIGRFMQMDPLAEKYYSISPYAYCGNNPVNRIDPTGMDWVEDKDGNAIWRAEYTKDNLPEGYKYIGTEYTIGNTKFTQYGEGEAAGLFSSKVENKESDQTSPQNAEFAPAIPWYAATSEIIGASALRMFGGVLSLLFLTGDTDSHKERFVSNDAYYPPPIELPGFPGSERVPSKGNRARWRLPDGSIGEWDSLHGEVEVYDKTGKKHKGAYDPKTGEKKKEGKPSRKTEK